MANPACVASLICLLVVSMDSEVLRPLLLLSMSKEVVIGRLSQGHTRT